MDGTILLIGWLADRLAPLAAAGAGGWLLLTRTATGRGLLRRVRDGAPSADTLAMIAEIGRLKRELADMQERLNYAERLIVQHHAALPPASQVKSPNLTPPDPVATPTH